MIKNILKMILRIIVNVRAAWVIKIKKIMIKMNLIKLKMNNSKIKLYLFNK